MFKRPAPKLNLAISPETQSEVAVNLATHDLRQLVGKLTEALETANAQLSYLSAVDVAARNLLNVFAAAGADGRPLFKIACDDHLEDVGDATKIAQPEMTATLVHAILGLQGLLNGTPVPPFCMNSERSVH